MFVKQKEIWCIFRVHSNYFLFWAQSSGSIRAPRIIIRTVHTKWIKTNLVISISLGPKGDQECILFTLNTYQATFVSDVLWCKCRNWKFGSGTCRRRRLCMDGQTRRLKKWFRFQCHRFSCNILRIELHNWIEYIMQHPLLQTWIF